MRKLLVTLDDELSPLLEKYPNQSEIVRESLRLYIGNISTGVLDGIRASYKIIADNQSSLEKRLKEIEAKLDYIARKL